MNKVVLDALELKERFTQGVYTPLQYFFNFDILVESLYNKENFQDHSMTEEIASVVTDIIQEQETGDQDEMHPDITEEDIEEFGSLYNRNIDVVVKLINDIEVVAVTSCPFNVTDNYPKQTEVTNNSIVLSYDGQ